MTEDVQKDGCNAEEVVTEDAENDVGNAEEEDTEGMDNNNENNTENDTQLNEKKDKLPRIHHLPLSPYSPTYLSIFPHPHARPHYL